MRMVIVVVLALIAIAAGGVWALGQFGGSAASVASEARAPLVREPEIIAAAAPAQGSPTSPNPALRSAPAAPRAPEPARPADTPAPPSTEPAVPAADPAAPPPEPKPNLKTGLDETDGLKIPAPPAQKQQAPSQPETPAAPQSDARVQAQSAPADAPAPRATPQQAAAAAPAGIEAQFKSRRLTYNRPPEKLALDKPIDVSLIIDTSRQTDAAERLQGLPGTIVERDVDLSDTVSAELLGAAFDIQLQTTSTRQKLSSKLANEWRWRVTPRQKGTHTLTLNVYGFAVGSADAEPLDSYRDDITVEVQPVDEIVTWAKSVQPVFAVLAALAGLGSATFAFLRFREEKKQTKVMTSRSDQ